jgi:hypothetical protein
MTTTHPPLNPPEEASMSITERADHHIGPTPDPTEVSARLGRWCFSRVADRADVIALGQ